MNGCGVLRAAKALADAATGRFIGDGDANSVRESKLKLTCLDEGVPAAVLYLCSVPCRCC